MKNFFLNEKVQKAVEIFFTLFGLYVLYQILRKIFGGSWSIEELTFSLVVLIIGFIFTLAITMSKMKTEVAHLKNQFQSLATDFKAHRNEFIQVSTDVQLLKKDIHSLRKDMSDLKKSFVLLAADVRSSLKK